MKITSTSHPGLEFDTESPAYQHFLDWLRANGAPEPTLEEGEPVGMGLLGPQELVFHLNGQTFRGEALAFYLSPSMSLTDLQRELSFGDPYHAVVYPPYAPPAPPPVIRGKVDKKVPGRPGFWSVTDVWMGKIAFGELAKTPEGRIVELVDEGGPFNRAGLWQEI